MAISHYSITIVDHSYWSLSERLAWHSPRRSAERAVKHSYGQTSFYLGNHLRRREYYCVGHVHFIISISITYYNSALPLLQIFICSEPPTIQPDLSSACHYSNRVPAILAARETYPAAG